MEEKKGILSALAETLKQYELNQSDNKESLAIALEEKLDEIAKMISSLSDRVDHLSSRVNHIGDKVDELSAAEPRQKEELSPEPVFDAEEVDSSFHLPEDEFETEDPVFEDEEPDFEEEENIPEEEVEEEEVEEQPEAEEVAEEHEAEEVEEEETETEENIAEEEVQEEQKAQRDWYDWEVDYPAEYVEDLMGSMGINDKLEFMRELFGSDPQIFDRQMKEIDSMPNFKAIVSFFRQAHPDWDQESDTVYRFYMHIRRKFRN